MGRTQLGRRLGQHVFQSLARWTLYLAAVALLLATPERVEAQTATLSPIVLRTRCNQDIGSSTAREMLAQARALPPSGSGVADAIATCEKREKDLRRQEDSKWVAALEAKNKWDCVDAKRQFVDLQKVDTFYKAQAILELRKLGNCGERITVADSPDTAMNRAETALRTGDFSAARETAWKFVALSNSIGQRARTLLQTVEQREKVNSMMTQANATYLTRRSESCSLMMRIEEEYGALPNLDLGVITTRLKDCRLALQAASMSPQEKRREFEKKLEAARDNLQKGNLELASDALKAADTLVPNDKAQQDLKQAVQAAKDFRTALERSIALIYESKNLQALERLQSVLAVDPTSQALAAQAHFYMGVAMAKQFYVFDDSMYLDYAKREFRISLEGYPSPDFANMPSEIKELYGQVARGREAGTAL